MATSLSGSAVKRVLIVTFPFPPMIGSSGVQRPLSLVRHLPDQGWQPIVLSAHPRAYESTDDGQLRDIPAGVPVHRSFALDIARPFGTRSRYPIWLALPDRWASWAISGWWTGLKLIRQYRPQLIWSTYPIASAHLIAARLQRSTGLPWIADFRDPMVEDDYPADQLQRASHERIERRAAQHAATCVFVTEGTRRLYINRYGEQFERKSCVIANGWDEDTLSAVKATPRPAGDSRLILLHSGFIDPSLRDPRAFFEAIAELLREGRLAPNQLQVVLRGPSSDSFLSGLITQHAIGSIVRIEPPVSHRDSLAEMLGADALLVLQASNCNDQIPAKLYEYFGTRKPILGLTDPIGETAAAMREAGVTTIANLHNKDEIKHKLLEFVDLLSRGAAPISSEAAAKAQTRRQKSLEVAGLFDRMLAQIKPDA